MSLPKVTGWALRKLCHRLSPSADAERGTHNQRVLKARTGSVKAMGASEPSGGNCQAYFDLGKPLLNKEAFGGSGLN